MSKPVIFVIGASGNVGFPTVQNLSVKFSDRLEIRAGVRNPDKADKLKGLKGVSVVQADMEDKDKLVDTFKGVDALYIIVPSRQDRTQLTIATAEAAKSAGVKHLLVVSVVSPALDTIFGKNFHEIEVAVAKLGLPHTFLRLPYFAENYISLKSSIVQQSKLFLPVNPSKPFTAVTMADAGLAGAVILSDPSKHVNKTYTIVSDQHTFGKLVIGLSDVLGKNVEYVRVSYEDDKKANLSIGIPEWVADGAQSYFKLVDSGALSVTQSEEYLGDFERITGEKPTSLRAWLEVVADSFKP